MIKDWSDASKRMMNIAVVIATIVVVSLILGYGFESSAVIPPELAVGQPSPETFTADRSKEVADPDATAIAKQTAENNVPAPYKIDRSVDQGVFNYINSFYFDLQDGAYGDLPVIPDVVTPNLVGMNMVDALAAAADVELTVTVVQRAEPPDETLDGRISSQVPAEGISVKEGSDISVVLYEVGSSSTTTAPPTTTTTVLDVTPTTLPRIDVDEQVVVLLENYAILGEPTIRTFVELQEKDIDRVFDGGLSVFPAMLATSVEWANEALEPGIREHALTDVQQTYLDPTTRPPIAIAELPDDDVGDTSDVMATLVANRLRINETVDDPAWNVQKQAARDAVPDQTASYDLGDTIVEEGERLTSVHVNAITQLGLYTPEISAVVPLAAKVIFGIVSVLVLAFLIARIAPKLLGSPRRIIIVGIIVGLSAAASRVPEIVSVSNHAVGYLIPAVAIGVMAAILFDQKTALLFVIPMAGFTAVSTVDVSFVMFAAIATAIPVALVSSVSTRPQLRLSILASAAVVAPVAAALEYLFVADHTGAAALQAGAWAFLGAVIGGFIGQGLVSFLESAFGITTSMSLLDLLDRNHPALQLLEEKAPGTFNHSMLVGAIAGKVARAIGADPLLAQAAAWYHDLGKTEHPQYFVENQLGVNPHDELTPEASAEIIRTHVTVGMALAKRFRIPDDVADGIRMHHGTSLMRYFYHKALALDPDTDPESYRHHGQKPTRKELAIVMIADATEAAARAYAQAEQPTEEGLSKLVESIVAEKLEDGQFDDSSLTFGELTVIKQEVIKALTSYYHARVEYPDFPMVPSTGAS